MPPLSAEHTSVPAGRVDEAEWYKEVHVHEPKLRAWLRARFPSLNDLDDIVQESYARLFRALGSKKVLRAKPYLYSTARNAALDFYRHEQVIPLERITEIGRLAVLDSRPDAAETTSHDEELALLHEAIQALPERCREVLVLRKLHGFSQKEIARKLGLSENTD